MSAGTGITHSEFNHSKTEPVHFLQIWITPSTRGIAPGYEQKTIDDAKAHGGFAPVGAPDGGDRSVKIHQDAALSVAKLERGQTVATNLKKGRHGWVQVARGAVTVNGTALAEGDGAAISDEEKVSIVANAPAEVLFFDLA
jgi:quercetin 2,3-dioxygenase